MNKLKIVVNTFTKKKKLIIHVAVKFFMRIDLECSQE